MAAFQGGIETHPPECRVGRERVETRVSESPALPLKNGYEHQVKPARALDAARQDPPNR